MTKELRQPSTGGEPPAGLSPAKLGAWWAVRGDWQAAHRAVQAAPESDAAAAWVHAYLHRQEGDLDNARYWYGLAGRRPGQGSLAAELDEIVGALAVAG